VAYSTTIATGARQVVNVNSKGATASNDQPEALDYSAGGDYVLFESDSPDYGQAVCHEYGCVYRRNLTTNQVTLVSVLPGGKAASAEDGVMSKDGNVVSFIQGDPQQGDDQLYTRRLDTGKTVLNSKNSAGNNSNGMNFSPSVNSGDTLVAFVSTATNLGTNTSSGGFWFAHSGV
ncbi:MAG: hypothetical protein J2P17_12515, partial [Mycobacterium sp.]|nr:hypothetical protein [Mycobacterium sp.]